MVHVERPVSKRAGLIQAEDAQPQAAARYPGIVEQGPVVKMERRIESVGVSVVYGEQL